MGGGVAVLEALIPALAQRADWSICVLRPHAVSNAFMAHGVIYVVLGRVGGIVAWEFGIPAVVACGDATSRITDGARVCVDAEAGRVTLLG